MSKGDEFWAIQLFDQQGYYGIAMGRLPSDVKARVASRSSATKSLVCCSLPFRGSWSASGTPDVSLPDDFKAVLGHLDKPGDD